MEPSPSHLSHDEVAPQINLDWPLLSPSISPRHHRSLGKSIHQDVEVGFLGTGSMLPSVYRNGK
jgi:hypothetical protein